MKDGWFIRYGNKIVIQPIDEHERFLRATRVNKQKLKKLGLSNDLIDLMPKIALNREGFLRFVLANAPIIRVRGQGVYCTFEYWADGNDEAFRAILAWCKSVGAGDMLLLNICNLNTEESFRHLVMVFKASLKLGKRIKSVKEMYGKAK